jgi:flagellar motor switch protein FliG
MKPIDEMSGTEKAAAFLVAIGHDAASDILRHMEEKEVIAVSHEIARIETLSPEQKEDLIGEFYIRIRKMKGVLPAGEPVAKRFLTDAFGEDRAERIVAKFKYMNQDESFTFLKEATPEEIVDLVTNEHPQIVAVMMVRIPSAQAGAVMKLLPKDMKKEVALRMAKMGAIAPEAVAQASIALHKKYETLIAKGSGSSREGVSTIAEIMNHMHSDAEKRIMDHFDDEIPDFADAVRKRISVFEFEAIAQLTNREIRLVLSKIPENRMLAKALKGSEDDIRFRVLRNISTNRAEDIISLMDLMGPIRLSEVNEARTQIVSIMKDLSAKGTILIRKAGDEIVD